MRTRTLAIAVGAALVGVLMSGCAALTPWQQVAATWQLDTDESGRVLLVASYNGSVRPTAVEQGNLVLVGGTCFGLAGEYGEATIGFPKGTTITATGLNIPGFGDLDLGDWIEGGGGTLSVEETGLADTIPAECIGVGFGKLNPFDD